MSYSPHQLAYFAHQLTRRAASNSMDRMAGALMDAQVDLNPHQIDAALFATSNPLSKGAILADEVGLGKTIEAGLLIAQCWAERKRRILVITPANLRKQWHQELADKFGLAASLLEAKSYRQADQGRCRQSVRPCWQWRYRTHLLLPIRRRQGQRRSVRAMGFGGYRRSTPPA